MKKKGMTLIELLIVLAILGIVAMITSTILQGGLKVYQKGIDESTTQNDVRGVFTYLSNQTKGADKLSTTIFPYSTSGNIVKDGATYIPKLYVRQKDTSFVICMKDNKLYKINYNGTNSGIVSVTNYTFERDINVTPINNITLSDYTEDSSSKLDSSTDTFSIALSGDVYNKQANVIYKNNSSNLLYGYYKLNASSLANMKPLKLVFNTNASNTDGAPPVGAIKIEDIASSCLPASSYNLGNKTYALQGIYVYNSIFYGYYYNNNGHKFMKPLKLESVSSGTIIPVTATTGYTPITVSNDELDPTYSVSTNNVIYTLKSDKVYIKNSIYYANYLNNSSIESMCKLTRNSFVTTAPVTDFTETSIGNVDSLPLCSIDDISFINTSGTYLYNVKLQAYVGKTIRDYYTLVSVK